MKTNHSLSTLLRFSVRAHSRKVSGVRFSSENDALRSRPTSSVKRNTELVGLRELLCGICARTDLVFSRK